MSDPASDSPADPSVSAAVMKKEVQQAWSSFRNLGSSLVTTWSIALLVRFLLPRHLGPVLYGELIYADVVASSALLIATLGIDTYTAREIAVRPKHAADYFSGVTAVRAVISVFALAGTVLFLYSRGKGLEILITAGLYWLQWALASFNSTLATMLRAVGVTGRLAVSNVVSKALWGAGLAAAVWSPGGMLPLWAFAIPALAAEIVRTLMTFAYAAKELQLRARINVAATRMVLTASFPFLLSTLSHRLSGPLNFAVLDYRTTDPREFGWFAAMMSLGTLGMMFTPLLDWVLLPLLARARARSAEEVSTIIGFAVEGFVLCVLPLTVLGVLGAELWIRLAFGASYLPAALSFRIVIVTIVVTYTAIILNLGLVASGFTWSLSWLSFATLILAPSLSWFAVPGLGHWFGPGGQAAGAALATNVPECVVVIVSLLKLDERVRSGRLRSVMLRAAFVCVAVGCADHALRPLGDWRLAIDLVLYFGLLLVTGAVNVKEVRLAIATVRTAKSAPA